MQPAAGICSPAASTTRQSGVGSLRHPSFVRECNRTDTNSDHLYCSVVEILFLCAAPTINNGSHVYCSPSTEELKRCVRHPWTVTQLQHAKKMETSDCP